jgi:hypothetical protein
MKAELDLLGIIAILDVVVFAGRITRRKADLAKIENFGLSVIFVKIGPSVHMADHSYLAFSLVQKHKVRVGVNLSIFYLMSLSKNNTFIIQILQKSGVVKHPNHLRVG